MFPKKFANDATVYMSTHQAIKFMSDWSAAKITKEIVKHGIAAFLKRDHPYSMDKAYENGRIAGAPNIVGRASCCAFSKNTSYFYLYPIHEAQLKGVGLVEDDLIRYIKTFNDMKVGFKFLYFGKQDAGDVVDSWFVRDQNAAHSPIDKVEYPNREMFWIGVPQFLNPKSYNGKEPYPNNVSYLHWIVLRYLLNGIHCGSQYDWEPKPHYTKILAYYNIPRVMFHLIDDHNMDPFRAFLYTHALGPWFEGWGLCYSNYGGDSPTYRSYIPDLGVSKAQFKAIWYSPSRSGQLMNGMLTSANNSNDAVVANKWQLGGKHHPRVTAKLFYEGKVVEAIALLDKAYGFEKSSIGKPKTKVNGKAIRKVVRKKKSVAAN